MSVVDLNLAAKPFVDRRPLRRTVMLLWIVGIVLVAINAMLYFQLYAGTSQARRQQAEMRTRIVEERAQIVRLNSTLSKFDREVHNERVRFINRRIEARVFSWSGLFDDLAEVLPADVRLVSLAPQFWGGRRERAGRQEVASGEVPLEIRGVARNGEVMLELIDRLFAHGDFHSPDLLREARADDGLYDFDLRVIYDAETAAEEVLETADEAPAGAGEGQEAAGAENPDDEAEEAAREAAKAAVPPPAARSED